MYKDLKITVLNTKEELVSFPIYQSISLEFSEKIDETLLHNIFIVEDLDLPRLLHIGDTYNQNFGIVKESFKPIDIDYKVISETPYTVKVTPKTPLTPAQSYTLLVRDDVTSYSSSIVKTTSYSDSAIVLTDSAKVNSDLDIIIKITEDSEYKNDSHYLTFSVNGKPYSINLSKNSSIVFDNIHFLFSSDFYVKDEEFHVSLKDTASKLYSSFLVPFTCSTSKNIKPIVDTNNRLTNLDIEKYNASLDNNGNTTSTLIEDYEIVTTGLNSFVVNFKSDIVDSLDLEDFEFTFREAFNMYTLINLGMYDPFLKYTVKIEKVSDKEIEVFANEVKL